MNGIQKDRLRYRVKRLLTFIDLNAPLPILAAEIMFVFRSGFVTCGDAMGNAFGEWMQSKVRADAGLCQTCNTSVNGVLPEFCEYCEARQETEMREIEDEAAAEDAE